MLVFCSVRCNVASLFCEQIFLQPSLLIDILLVEVPLRAPAHISPELSCSLCCSAAEHLLSSTQR